MSEFCVEFRQVSQFFGDQSVFEHLDLQLPQQKVTALIGPSGCGKSTLLQMMNGLVWPQAGEVRVLGAPLDRQRLSEQRRSMGYAVQHIGLFPHWTVRRNMSVMAALEGWSPERQAARLDKLLDFMQLDAALLDRYPHQISGGQAQRVGLCRAMFLDPPLLLLDEAFSAVDPITKIEVHARFQAIQAEEPRSVVLVTHDMQEALKLADWLVVLGPGAVLQMGTPEQIQTQPAHPQVARLLEAQ
ncbi:ATP-binding cassette domain-containing protein [Marinospirillum sp.]|uniref:ATP-binding cassette domain-containing protein n=1 Tax=Marinospirillum sp. TaxID=2183934 RepID=UPI003A8BB39F